VSACVYPAIIEPFTCHSIARVILLHDSHTYSVVCVGAFFAIIVLMNPMSSGWFASELCRRVDPQRRDVGQFVQDEVR
jgi:hypothetical protein